MSHGYSVYCNPRVGWPGCHVSCVSVSPEEETTVTVRSSEVALHSVIWRLGENVTNLGYLNTTNTRVCLSNTYTHVYLYLAWPLSPGRTEWGGGGGGTLPGSGQVKTV